MYAKNFEKNAQAVDLDWYSIHGSGCEPYRDSHLDTATC